LAPSPLDRRASNSFESETRSHGEQDRSSDPLRPAISNCARGLKWRVVGITIRFRDILSSCSLPTPYTRVLVVADVIDPCGRLRNLIALVAIAIDLASWSQKVEYTDQQRVGITQRYIDYDAKKLSQCVDVCKACMSGNNVPCIRRVSSKAQAEYVLFHPNYDDLG